MLIILSQKIDSESSYEDELFRTYHYPRKYRNQIHTGDTFIYYQGNRFDRAQRYYFGVGTIGEILSNDEENYYAKLVNCRKFERNVPIYLPDGYIEQLGYETVRNSINPPWQTSIRPLSQKAFDCILNLAGTQIPCFGERSTSIDMLKERLKVSIREFFLKDESSAIYRIEGIASQIGRITSTYEEHMDYDIYIPQVGSEEKVNNFIEYCKTMQMTYSYKAVLILAFIHAGDGKGNLTIDNATNYFKEYYAERKKAGLPAEKKPCIYLREGISDKDIANNICANPVKALVGSGFFSFNERERCLTLSPEIWGSIRSSHKAQITRICKRRLKEYYGE